MVTFSGTELERILINEGNSVLIKHENLTGVVEGPLAVNMRYAYIYSDTNVILLVTLLYRRARVAQ